jgi:hypothetical protein
MDMLVSPVQPWNAPSPILVTLLGMVVVDVPNINLFVAVSISALQLSLLSNTLLSGDTYIEAKFEQP